MRVFPDDTFAGILLIFYFVYLALIIVGAVFAYIATTHSVKRRIVSGEDFSAGTVFLWMLGWSCAMAYSCGIATIIYFIVKRSEINAVKLQCSQTLGSIRMMRANQYAAYQQQQYQQYQQQYQQPYQQQPPQPPQSDRQPPQQPY